MKSHLLVLFLLWAGYASLLGVFAEDSSSLWPLHDTGLSNVVEWCVPVASFNTHRGDTFLVKVPTYS